MDHVPHPTWPPTEPVVFEPIEPAEPPGVLPWFVVYSVIMSVMYLLVLGLGLLFLAVDPAAMQMEPMEANITGGVYAAIGGVLFVPFALAPFLPKARGVWVYDLVLICLGMTSCCTLPACIPLLIFWIQPGTRRFFGW